MDNPWQVNSIQAFSCLKCPECVFDTKEENNFKNHALDNHPLSFVLFGKNEVDTDALIDTDDKISDNCDANITLGGETLSLEVQNNPKIVEDESSNNDADYSDKHFDDVSVVKSEPIEDIVVEPLIEYTDEEIDEVSSINCNQCDFVCEFKTSLNRHTMTFHGNRKYFDSEFKCKICGNGYKSNEGLATHFSYEHEKSPLKCDLCSFTCSSTFGLKNHNSEAHEGKRKTHTYQCHMCQYSSNYKESLKAHLHLVHKQFDSELATMITKRNKAKRQYHKKQVNSIEPKKSEFEEGLTENANVTNYSEEHFVEVGKIKEELIEDIVVEPSIEDFMENPSEKSSEIDTKLSEGIMNELDKPKKDQITNTIDVRDRILAESRKISNVRYYKPKKQFRPILPAKATNSPIKESSGQKIPNFPIKTYIRDPLNVSSEQDIFACHMCNYKHKKEFFLKTHIESTHKQIYRQHCTLCNYSTYTIENLNNHLKCHPVIPKEHEFLEPSQADHIPFACSLCSYSSTDELDFKTHIESDHEKNDDQSYTCSFCDYTTQSLIWWVKHLKSIFHCNICDERFHGKSNNSFRNYKRHMKKHTKSPKQLPQGEKKRKKTAFSHHCSICNKNFPYKSYLDRHMSCVHAPNLYKSNVNKSLDQKYLELEDKKIEKEINMDSENQPKKQKMEEQIETWDFENSVDAVNVTEEPNDQSHLTAEQISFIPDDTTKKRSRKQNIEERRTF